MKVIVINDSDGHCKVLGLSIHNLVSLLRECVKEDMCPDRTTAKTMSRRPMESLDIEEMEKFVLDNCPVDRRGGGRIYIEEVLNWKEGYSPFS